MARFKFNVRNKLRLGLYPVGLLSLTSTGVMCGLMSKMEKLHAELFSGQLSPSEVAEIKEVLHRLTVEADVTSMAVGGGLLVASLILILGLGRNLANKTQKIRDFMVKVSEGDLTQKLHIKGGDEMTEIADAMNELIDKLGKTVCAAKSTALSLQESSETLSSVSQETYASSTEIASTIEQLANGAINQTEMVYSTNNSIDIMLEDLMEVVKGIRDIHNGSEVIATKASEGKDKVQDAVVRIDEIKDITAKIKKVILALNDKSEHINEIVEVINEVSKRTNLLALNSRIESTKAGEFGRGFAVVANEVKELSEETSKSTKKIGELIANIQEDIVNAVECINEGSNRVDAGVDAVNTSTEAFGNIIDIISSTVEEVNRVNDKANNAIHTVIEVVDNIHTISDVATEATANTEEAAGLTEHQNQAMQLVVDQAVSLTDASVKLTDTISVFKTER